MVSEQCVVLELLDTAQGATMMTWRLEQPHIRIGRASENDVVVGDSTVSRLHVELRLEAGAWRLYNRGRNGVLFQGEPVTDGWLSSGDVFRLGRTGPRLRFSSLAGEDPSPQGSGTQTANEIAAWARQKEAVKLELDAQAQQRAVDDIVNHEFFQQLQSRARALRARRRTGGDSPAGADS